MAIETLPKLVFGRHGWTLDGFVPGQPAFRWDEFARKNGTLYVIQSGDFLKIGVTRDLASRVATLSAANPLPISIVAKRTISLAGLYMAEAWLHQRFAGNRLRNEWFAVDAEEVMAALPEAEKFARAYVRCCRDWFERNAVREINDAL